MRARGSKPATTREQASYTSTDTNYHPSIGRSGCHTIQLSMCSSTVVPTTTPNHSLSSSQPIPHINESLRLHAACIRHCRIDPRSAQSESAVDQIASILQGVKAKVIPGDVTNIARFKMQSTSHPAVYVAICYSFLGLLRQWIFFARVMRVSLQLGHGA